VVGPMVRDRLEMSGSEENIDGYDYHVGEGMLHEVDDSYCIGDVQYIG
jgi:hypothetical protein